MKLSSPAWPRRLPTGLVLAFATLGPLGRKLPAPGTWGSVAGLLYFLVFFSRANLAENLVASAVGLYFAVALCGEAEIRLRKTDPGEVILDEFIAIPLCFLGWHKLIVPLPAWAVLLAGFGLFRLYDILKPFGIRRLQKLPGGWGVAIDDTVAALATCVTLHLGVWLWTTR